MRLLLFFVLSQITISISGQVYYIETTGIDDVSRDGLTPATAWASLSFACEQVAPYDTIQFGIGTFVEDTTSYPPSHLTIMGVDTIQTVVKASINWTTSDTMRYDIPTDYMIYIKDKDSLTISNIYFKSEDTSQMVNGVLYAERSDYITVTNVKLENFRWSGLRYFINNYCTIAYSTFRNCSQYRDQFWSGHIRTRYFNDGLIHDNRIESDWGGGYGYKASGHRRTKFYNNEVSVRGSFSVESAHENEYEFEIFNNKLTGTISVPKGGDQPNPADGGYAYSVWIHHNELEDSYTVEGPRNHMTISHNHIDIKHLNGRVYTCFGGFNSGPVYIHHNLVEGIDRSFIWKNAGVIDSIHIFNNTIIADSTPRNGALVDLGPFNNGHSAQGWTFTNNVVIAPAAQRRNLHWPSAQQAANLYSSNNIFMNVDLVPDSNNNKIDVLADLNYAGADPYEYYGPSCPSGNTVDKGIFQGQPYLGIGPDIGALEYDIQQKERLPFDSISIAIPGVIEFEKYDIDSSGMSFQDDSLKEGDLTYRPLDNVDICNDLNASNGYVLCYVEANEWLEYTVDITPGIYDIILKRSNTSSNTDSILLTVNGSLVAIYEPSISASGVFVQDTLYDVIISDADCGVLRCVFTGDVGHLDNLRFNRKGEIPVLGIDITNCPSVDLFQGAMYKLAYTTLPVDAANQEVMWASSDLTKIVVDSLGQLNILDTTGGAWIKVTTVDGGYQDSCYISINEQGQSPYQYLPQHIPGRIEAEHYDEGGLGNAYYDGIDVDRDCHERGDEVDTESCQDLGGGCNTGWSNTGEWLEYTLTAEPGIYAVHARMASNNNSGRIAVIMDSIVLTQLTTPSVSSGWQDWHTASDSNIVITGGEHLVRVYLEQGSFNLNWIEYEKIGDCICTTNNSNCIRSGIPEENKNRWIGGTYGVWDASPCNWSKGCLPTQCDDVIIPENIHLVIPEGVQADGFTMDIGIGATIVISNGALFNIK